MAKTSYKVFWTQSAEYDLVTIATYIASESTAIARKKFSTIKSKAASLEDFPLRGRVVPELQQYNITNYKEIFEGPWRITFTIRGENIYVLAIIDGRRDVEDILLARILQNK